MQLSKVSPQGQTSIPAKIRRKLEIKPGDNLRWEVLHDELGVYKIIVSVPTKASIRSLRGVAGDLYRKYGGGSKYLESERRTWQK